MGAHERERETPLRAASSDKRRCAAQNRLIDVPSALISVTFAKGFPTLDDNDEVMFVREVRSAIRHLKECGTPVYSVPGRKGGPYGLHMAEDNRL